MNHSLTQLLHLLTLITGGATGKSFLFSVKSFVLSVALMITSLSGWMDLNNESEGKDDRLDREVYP